MASMRDIKRRIKSVGSTKKITKAMNLVAASKLQRAKAKQIETRPYFLETKKVIASVVSNSKGIKHPFLMERGNKKVAVIVVTSDRGLCGGYNSNILKEVLSFINKKEENSLVIVGTKGRDYFNRRNKNIVHNVNGISEKPDYVEASKISDLVLKMYIENEVDEVYLAYTEFESTISHLPKINRLLPVEIPELETEKKEQSLELMSYEPSAEEVLSYLIPKYVSTIIYGALVESSTCEQAARMISMDSATENAEGMIGKLNLIYNRARQGAITQEITEIVSGANALE